MSTALELLVCKLRGSDWFSLATGRFWRRGCCGDWAAVASLRAAGEVF